MGSEQHGLYPRGFSAEQKWSWPLVPAHKLVKLNYGKALRATDRSEGSIPVYGTNGQCGMHDKSLVKGPGVILGRKGQGPLGVEWCDGDFWVIDTAYYVSREVESIDLRYFYYLTKYIGLNHLKDGTSNPSLSRDTFALQLLPLPPITKQKSMVEILRALDDKIELNRRMNGTLEGMAQALFKSWFVDFDPVLDNALAAGNPIPEELAERAEIRRQALSTGSANREAAKPFPAAFQLTEELGWIPEGWKVKKADEIAKITIGKAPPRKEPHWFSDIGSGNVVWVSIRDMGSCGAFIGDSNEYLTPESVDRFNVQVIPKGSVILSFKLTIGRVSITQKEMATNEVIAHFVNPKFELTKEFLYCYLTSFDFSSLGSTSSIATAVNSKIIKEMPFLVPNCTLLEGFKRTTQSWFESISNKTVQAQTLTKLRDTLLPKLISGELRIPDAEKLTEEALA